MKAHHLFYAAGPTQQELHLAQEHAAERQMTRLWPLAAETFARILWSLVSHILWHQDTSQDILRRILFMYIHNIKIHL